MPNNLPNNSVFHTENPPLLSQSKVPHEKPQLLPGKSAAHEFLLFAVVFIAFCGGLAAALNHLEASAVFGIQYWILICVIVLVSAGAVFLLYRAYWRAAKRFYAELDAGYVTLQLNFGGFGINRRPFKSRWLSYNWSLRTPWDYRGLWELDAASGRVKRSPDFAIVAPGFYPSPFWPDKYELWTGAVWAGVFRETAPIHE